MKEPNGLRADNISKHKKDFLDKLDNIDECDDFKAPTPDELKAYETRSINSSGRKLYVPKSDLHPDFHYKWVACYRFGEDRTKIVEMEAQSGEWLTVRRRELKSIAASCETEKEKMAPYEVNGNRLLKKHKSYFENDLKRREEYISRSLNDTPVCSVGGAGKLVREIFKRENLYSKVNH